MILPDYTSFLKNAQSLIFNKYGKKGKIKRGLTEFRLKNGIFGTNFRHFDDKKELFFL
jgi:hypothetical protein